jgi:putative aldouronate transport system permease protein
MQIGNMLSVGSEKILLLYNPSVYETADVISTYVYRRGLIELSWSFSSAVGLFNSIVNFMLVFMANTMSRKLTENSLF